MPKTQRPASLGTGAQAPASALGESKAQAQAPEQEPQEQVPSNLWLKLSAMSRAPVHPSLACYLLVSWSLRLLGVDGIWRELLALAAICAATWCLADPRSSAVESSAGSSSSSGNTAVQLMALQGVLRMLTDGCFLLDHQGRLAAANRQAAALVGLGATAQATSPLLPEPGLGPPAPGLRTRRLRVANGQHCEVETFTVACNVPPDMARSQLSEVLLGSGCLVLPEAPPINLKGKGQGKGRPSFLLCALRVRAGSTEADMQESSTRRRGAVRDMLREDPSGKPTVQRAWPQR